MAADIKSARAAVAAGLNARAQRETDPAAGDDSVTAVDSTDDSAAFFTLNVTAMAFEFAPHGDRAGPCTLGHFVSTVTLVRWVRHKPNSKLTIGLKTLYNALGMLRFAQYAIAKYNSALEGRARTDSLDACVKTHLQKPWLDLHATLGERLEPDEAQSIPGLDALVAAIESKCALRLQASRANLAAGVVFFDDLGEVYTPGKKVVSTGVAGAGLTNGFTVLWSKYTEGKSMTGNVSRNFEVCLECWVSVGRAFMPVVFTDKMFMYERSRSVASLFFRPLVFGADGEGFAHADAQPACTDKSLLLSLEARGIQYSKVTKGKQYLQYAPGRFSSRRGRETRADSTSASKNSGRILLDTEWGSLVSVIARGNHDYCRDALLACHAAYKQFVRENKTTADDAWPQDGRGDGGGGAHSAVPAVFTSPVGVFIYSEVPPAARWTCWPLAVGFSFTAKSWGVVAVGEPGLAPVAYNDRAFELLVLPPARKRLIKAVVQFSSGPDGQGGASDIIAGKGEGSVFLFYGPPGVGKTLTAEAIAEMLHRPLYQVSMGELGTTPQELEAGLKTVLEMCSRWDALVLLDEADIFVERRSAASGIMRNAMVSVMLRMLERFAGVLFLTTNRVQTFDPAFQTRITAAIRYDNLDADSRTAVWRNLIEASGAICDDDVDPVALGKYPLNGRVIKNALRLSLALAWSEAQDQGGVGRLTQAALVETVEMVSEFNLQLDDAASRQQKTE